MYTSMHVFTSRVLIVGYCLGAIYLLYNNCLQLVFHDFMSFSSITMTSLPSDRYAIDIFTTGFHQHSKYTIGYKWPNAVHLQYEFPFTWSL